MNSPQQQTLFGHPAGLYTLFFAEMWERFSYYGMRALLIFYMLKDFLQYGDGEAYAVYGAYTALVYMTPFFGGMLADGFLGARRAVVLGGLLMASGQLLLMLPNVFAFYVALALLIVGNGFFKPNISTMVGSLYPDRSAKRDGGFTIFYMGINLGAAMSPVLCGYIGETYGWGKGFGLAAVGMLTGLAVFVLPGKIAKLIIMAGALAAAAIMLVQHPANPYATALNVFLGAALVAAAIIAWFAIERGGLPLDAGQPRNPELLSQPMFGVPKKLAVYLGSLLAVPVLALMVSGFAPVTTDGKPIAIVSDSAIKDLKTSENPLAKAGADVIQRASTPAGLVLVLAGLIAVVHLGISTFRLDRVPRERMFVVLILMFFVMLFWAFFEQAGSSVNNFTDRNIDRVFQSAQTQTITSSEIGQIIRLEPTQEQLGYHNGKRLFTLNDLDALRKDKTADEKPNAKGGSAVAGTNADFEIDWTVAPDNVGMHVAVRADEVPASYLQSVNPVCILVFGLIFSALWGFLGARGLEPSTPFKFALGLLQLALGFAAFWYGAESADQRGMVFVGWLFLGYLFHTTGELCLSPVGLSMVTKLSPRELVSTVMGAWFLATAFSQFLAGIIAQFTRVDVTGTQGAVPAPHETVGIYGTVFGQIALASAFSALICFALVPLLKRWMHEDANSDAPESSA